MSARENILFCAQCFASSKDGSWGEVVSADGCANCGCSGSGILIPAWAVKSIREQASWVGKRFYPHNEDKAGHDELVRLRASMKEFPGRSVKPSMDPELWWVEQIMPNETVTAVMVRASSAAEALEAAKTKLPWVASLPQAHGGQP